MLTQKADDVIVARKVLQKRIRIRTRGGVVVVGSVCDIRKM